MNLTTEQKHLILAEVKVRNTNYSTDKNYAKALDVSASQLSKIKKGEIDQTLSDAKWLYIARRFNINLNANAKQWITAETTTYLFITTQLAHCQKHSLSALLVDYSDLGKTYTAKQYTARNKNSVYVDCSQVKSKQLFIRKVAKEFGLGNSGKYSEVYADLVYYLNTLPNPLIILDEAGDLDYPAFLELKALWNATERQCGWFMMGADGLKAKINRGIDYEKVGFTEIFSRFGGRVQKITPIESTEREKFRFEQAAQIIKANKPDADVKQLLAKTNGSLRRVYIELTK
jgi:DNA transposition AAA+ family ATPase